MTLQQLEYIVALDQHRHFVKAAEACGVTQSTLSSMLQKLELELDIQLFDRTQHPIEPTIAGRQLIDQAKVTLFHAAQLKEMALSERGQTTGELHLGVIPTVASYLVPRLILEMQKNNPSIQLRITEAHTDQLIHLLDRAEIDVAIMATPLEQPSLLEIPLYYEPFLAYLSPSSSLHYQSQIASDQIDRSQLWVLKEGHCFRNQILNICESNQEIASIYEAGSIDTLVRIVDLNGGYTIVPSLHQALLLPDQVSNLRPIVEPAPNREVSMVVRNDYVREGLLNCLSGAIKSFIPEAMLDERMKRFSIKL